MFVGKLLEAHKTDIGLVENRLVESRPEQAGSKAVETDIEVGSAVRSRRG